MIRKFILMVSLLAVGLSCLIAQDSTKYLSLKQCLKTGLESSQSMINAGLEKEKMLYQKQGTLSRLFPQIEGFGTYDNYVKLPVTMIPGDIFGQPGTTIPVSLAMKHNISTGLKATQTIYDKTAIAALSLSEKMKEISNINYDKVSKDLIYEITRLYFLVKVTDEQKIIFQENIKRLDRLLKVSEAQYDAGFIRSVDNDRVKVNRENLLTELQDLEVLCIQQVDMLGYLIGIKEKKNLVLTDSIQIELIDNRLLPYSSGKERPEILLSEKQKELALINKNVASSGYYPRVSIYGQYYFQGQRDKFDFFESGGDKWFKVGIVGLSVSVPVFDGFEKGSRINQSEADYLQASNNYEFTQRYIKIEYDNALNKYNSNREAERRQKSNINLAERVCEKMYLQYKQGIATLTDLLNAENGLNEARLSALNTTLNLRLAELDLLKASDNLKLILNK
jgi:outer membrane protein